MEAAGKIHLVTAGDLAVSAPILILIGFSLVTILMDVLVGGARRQWIPWIAALGLVVTFAELRVVGDALLGASDPHGGVVTAYYGCLRFDRMTMLAGMVILGASFFITVISPQFLRNRMVPPGEYYSLILLATVGMLGLAMSNELLTLFVNIELVSITLYVLAGIERGNLRSTEAAFKYFLTGSYAAAFLLFGLTMVYGATGTTMFDEIGAAVAAGVGASHAVYLAAGFALMLVGFGFKLTLAPFHMYAPDLYAGAPTPVAGLIATASKAAGLAVFFNFFRLFGSWGAMPDGLYYCVCAVAVLSIVIGNAGALTQPNIKRLLAYSGVAHAGYTLLPLIGVMHAARGGDPRLPQFLADAESAVTYYILAYSITTLAAFGVAATLGPAGDSQIDRYAGLGRRSPALALVLALSLISLTGIPVTAGFVGKFYLFSVAVKSGVAPLAVFGILASVMSAYYYLRVIVKMYMEESKAARAESGDIELANATALFVCSAGIFIFAIFPMIFLME